MKPKQMTIPGCGKREMPKNKSLNRMLWEDTPLFQVHVKQENEKIQPSLFPKK